MDRWEKVQNVILGLACIVSISLTCVLSASASVEYKKTDMQKVVDKDDKQKHTDEIFVGGEWKKGKVLNDDIQSIKTPWDYCIGSEINFNGARVKVVSLNKTDNGYIANVQIVNDSNADVVMDKYTDPYYFKYIKGKYCTELKAAFNTYETKLLDKDAILVEKYRDMVLCKGGTYTVEYLIKTNETPLSMRLSVDGESKVVCLGYMLSNIQVLDNNSIGNADTIKEYKLGDTLEFNSIVLKVKERYYGTANTQLNIVPYSGRTISCVNIDAYNNSDTQVEVSDRFKFTFMGDSGYTVEEKYYKVNGRFNERFTNIPAYRQKSLSVFFDAMQEDHTLIVEDLITGKKLAVRLNSLN